MHKARNLLHTQTRKSPLPQTSPPSQVANLDQESSFESELDFTDYEADIMEEVFGDCGETDSDISVSTEDNEDMDLD